MADVGVLFKHGSPKAVEPPTSSPSAFYIASTVTQVHEYPTKWEDNWERERDK